MARKRSGAVILALLIAGVAVIGFWANEKLFVSEDTLLERMKPADLLTEAQRKQNSEPVQFVVGRRLLLEKRYADALQAFQQALSGNPLSVRARAGVAAAAGHLGDLDTAERVFRELEPAAKDSADVSFFRGLLLNYLGDATNSLMYLQRAVALAPNQADNWYALSLSLGERGRKSEARDAAHKAAQLSPERIDFVVAAAELTVLVGEREEGLRQLEAAERRWTDQPLPKLIVARVLLKPDSASQSDLQRAERLIREALQLAPTWTDARTELARLQLRLNQPRAALETLETLSGDERNFGDTGYLYSQALFRTGKRQEGQRASRTYQKYYRLRLRCRDLEAKCEQEPDNAAAHLAAARSLAQIQYIPAALRHYREALQLNPDYQVARDELERLKAALMQPATPQGQ